MRTLVSVLEDAVARSARAVVLESGQPVVYTTPRGSEAERSVLPRTELFDMIAAAVDDNQQVELAVGNSVEFLIETGGSWTVIAEPGMDGMRVRATRPFTEDLAFAADVPILEPVLDPSTDPAVDLGFASGDGGSGDSLGASGRFESGSFDDGFALGATPGAGRSGARRRRLDGPAAPFESGTWALDDDDEFDVSLDPAEVGFAGRSKSDAGLPQAPPPSAAVPSLRTSDDYIGVPVDDDDESPFDPFATGGVGRTSRAGAGSSSVGPGSMSNAVAPTVRAMSVAPGRGEPGNDKRNDNRGAVPSVAAPPSARPPSGPAASARPPSGPAASARPPSGPAASARSPSAPAPVARPPSGPAPVARQPSGPMVRPASSPAPSVVPSSAPTPAPAVVATTPTGPRLAPVTGDHSMRATLRDIKAVGSSRAATRRELGVMGSPEAETHRELPSFGRGEPELNHLAAGIGEGSLVYVGEHGFAETLAQVFKAPSITIDDQVDLADAGARLRAMPVGAIVIISREDPSALLGWILRRLEEGFRVLLETRARSPEGARRMLLGLDASERAEAWLRSQTELVIEPDSEGPRIRPLPSA